MGKKWGTLISKICRKNCFLLRKYWEFLYQDVINAVWNVAAYSGPLFWRNLENCYKILKWKSLKQLRYFTSHIWSKVEDQTLFSLILVKDILFHSVDRYIPCHFICHSAFPCYMYMFCCVDLQTIYWAP